MELTRSTETSIPIDLLTQFHISGLFRQHRYEALTPYVSELHSQPERGLRYVYNVTVSTHLCL